MKLFSVFANKPAAISRPCQGEYIPMEEIPDEVFSQGILGPCCAIMPADGAVCAPCSGEITALADTLHAFCVESDGIEVLVHLGIDTVSLKGECFKARKKLGDKVREGDRIIDMDLDAVKAAGLNPAVIVVITNADSLGEIRFNTSSGCLMEVERKKQ